MRCRRCDHRRLFHQHHHPATYCSQCSCPAYAPFWKLWRRKGVAPQSGDLRQAPVQTRRVLPDEARHPDAG